MLLLRAILASAIAVTGAVLTIRMVMFGIRVETASGIVLGVAMIVLGIHRLRLIARARRPS